VPATRNCICVDFEPRVAWNRRRNCKSYPGRVTFSVRGTTGPARKLKLGQVKRAAPHHYLVVEGDIEAEISIVRRRDKMDGQARRHGDHAGETPADPPDRARIHARMPQDARDGESKRSGAVKYDAGKAGGASDGDVGMDRIPDPRALRIDMRQTSRYVDRENCALA
jgi:hypothetical protein